MSDRETLHHADVEGADETVTVGAYRWIHTLADDAKIPGAPNITLWAGGANSECGCAVELLPAETGLPELPRLLGDLLLELCEAARKAGPIDMNLLGDGDLDAYVSGLGHAGRVLAAEMALLAGWRSAAVAEKARREKTQAAAPTSSND